MTKKLIRDYLTSSRRRRDNAIGKVPNDIQARINNVVDLFEDRKIVIYNTAYNLIDGLMAKTVKEREKGVKAYNKAVAKYQEKEPVSDKQEEALKKAREVKQEKRTNRTLTRVKDIRKPRAGAIITQKANEQFRDRKAYSIEYMLFSKNKLTEKASVSFKVNGVPYYPIFPRPFFRTANIKANEFIETMVKRKNTIHFDKPLYRKMFSIMRTDTDFNDMMDGYFIDYTHAIRIERIVDVHDIPARDLDIREERLRNATENISIYHTYIETEIDAEYQTIKDAIQNHKYRENECWINALVETYEGTELMREKRSNKTAKTLSRDKVLELLNMKEDEFVEHGASINQMDVVFKHFNIPVKLYSFTNEIIYKHEPTTRAHTRIRTFLALVKNNHIYTINHNIESLRQKPQ